MKYFTPLFLFLAIVITSCTNDQKDHPMPNATSEIRNTIKNSDQVFVYEGLPHQMFESEQLKIEKGRKDTTIIKGYPFYTPKIKVTGNARMTLNKIISDTTNYSKFSGEKKCGGFHPDFLFEWTKGANTYSILFCYGCSEVILTDGITTYRYDFKFSDDLKRVFTKFDSKRPKQNGVIQDRMRK